MVIILLKIERIEMTNRNTNDEIDRSMDVHDIAFIDMINERRGTPGVCEEIYHKCGFKDSFKDYEQRAFRRLKFGDNYSKMISRAKKRPNGTIFREEIKNKFGTIFTPDFVVEKTCDLAFKYLPTGVDPLTLTYCDPAAGDGNFLIHLYDRLMKCSSNMNDVDKSEHILTKCLFGIEILKPNILACGIRLLNRHIDVMEKCGKHVNIDIFNKLNIHHGNTIMVPEDVGKWEIGEHEGGLLD